MMALMVPGLIILLVDHHNRVEEEVFMERLKKNPNLTLSVDGPQAQGVGLMDLFRHDHHAEHNHDDGGEKHEEHHKK